jgi:hypothetical protein
MRDDRSSNGDRTGVDALRASIERVSASLPPPAPPERKLAPMFRGLALVTAALALAIVGVWALRRGGGPTARTEDLAPRTAVEVKVLRLNGRDVEARVFEPPRGGAIVVAPRLDRPRVTRPGETSAPEGGAT